MNILISAYACEPGKGSEPAVGWNLSNEIAKHHTVHVITRSNNKTIIDKEIRLNPSGIIWHFYDLPWLFRFYKKGRRGVQIYYYFWQVGIYFFAKQIVKKFDIDLIHHITFVKYWVPSFLSFINKPFVWGPIGGGESPPPSFIKTFSISGKIKNLLRNIARTIAEFDPFLRYTAYKAKTTITVTKETQQRVKNMGCKNSFILSQVGFTAVQLKNIKKYANIKSSVKSIISVGNLLHLKGYNLSIKAFAIFVKKYPECVYNIIGVGPEMKNLKKISANLGIQKKMNFLGQIDRKSTIKNIAKADLMLHPTLHDSGGFASAEALICGTPVVCFDLGGPALQVNEKNGFRIAAKNPEQAITEIAKILISCQENPNIIQVKSKNAIEDADKKFNWEVKVQDILNIYRKIANENSIRS